MKVAVLQFVLPSLEPPRTGLIFSGEDGPQDAEDTFEQVDRNFDQRGQKYRDEADLQQSQYSHGTKNSENDADGCAYGFPSG